MNPLGHEIPRIRSRVLRYFFGNGYFHNSLIHSYNHNTDTDRFKMLVSCHRDYSEDTRPNFIGHCIIPPFFAGGPPVFGKEKKYKYTLRFDQVYHIEAVNVCGNDTIKCAQFKDTFQLRYFSEQNRRKLFQLRLIVDNGYIDIIFKSFSVRKQDKSEIKIPRSIPHFEPFNLPRYYLDDMDCKEAEATILNDIFTSDYYLIYLLCYHKDPSVLDLAMAGLFTLKKHEEIIACLYALGKLGDESHFPLLVEMLKIANTPLLRRCVLDAMEEIGMGRLEKSEEPVTDDFLGW